jgi:hypothetical protein
LFLLAALSGVTPMFLLRLSSTACRTVSPSAAIRRMLDLRGACNVAVWWW